MTDLSHLDLECQWGVDGKAEPLLKALASLSGLRELTLTRCKAMRRLIVPPKAELTKISLDSSELEVRDGCTSLSLTSSLLFPVNLHICPIHIQALAKTLPQHQAAVWHG